MTRMRLYGKLSETKSKTVSTGALNEKLTMSKDSTSWQEKVKRIVPHKLTPQ